MTSQQLQLELPLWGKSTLVNTHLGQVSSTQLGITLAHEHIFNKYPFRHKIASNSFIKQQLSVLKKYGVQTIVDLTPYTQLGRYKEIFETTDINIVCCIGFYLSKYVLTAQKKASAGELTKRLARDIELGRGQTGIRPGVLKVAGQNATLSDDEKKFFSVVSTLQKEYKLPIATHSPKGALSHLNYLINSGANPEHIYISHIDKGVGNDYLLADRISEAIKILDKGAYLLFCEFGNRNLELSQTTKNVVKLISELKKLGYLNQLLISADSSWRWKSGNVRLKDSRWSGIPRTYDYVFTNIIPILSQFGFSKQDFHTLLVENPTTLFSF